MQLVCAAFEDGRPIPRRYTADGKNVSPPLEWTGAPDAVRSFALVCDDPDAPRKVWVHWVLYDLAPETRGIPEGVPPEKKALEGATQGTNDFGKIGYGGPAPPAGRPHRYFFKLFALDAKVDLQPGATRDRLIQAMQGHVLAETQLVGTYVRDSNRE